MSNKRFIKVCNRYKYNVEIDGIGVIVSYRERSIYFEVSCNFISLVTRRELRIILKHYKRRFDKEVIV